MLGHVALAMHNLTSTHHPFGRTAEHEAPSIEDCTPAFCDGPCVRDGGPYRGCARAFNMLSRRAFSFFKADEVSGNPLHSFHV